MTFIYKLLKAKFWGDTLRVLVLVLLSLGLLMLADNPPSLWRYSAVPSRGLQRQQRTVARRRFHVFVQIRAALPYTAINTIADIHFLTG